MSQKIIKQAPKLKSRMNFTPRTMEHIAQHHKLLSISSKTPRNIAVVGGDKSYALLGSLAKLERALMRWTIHELTSKHQFTPIIVPNIIHEHIIENCGFPTRSQRSQVYKISGSDQESILDNNTTTLNNSASKNLPCIAGTSEFALASIHIGDSINVDELPKKYCALSRCYRAETSSTAAECGIYRVHYFNKVEMFALTMPDKSEAMHNEFLSIEKDLFSQLNLQFQVLEMPDDDLGLSAKRKFDVEAWLPGRNRYGEISSTSNCEEYQACRLNIRYCQMIEHDGQLQTDTDFVHTINGTACSSIRTLIAIFEQHQTEDMRVEIPDVLIPYIGQNKFIPTPNDCLLNDLDLYPETNR